MRAAAAVGADDDADWMSLSEEGLDALLESSLSVQPAERAGAGWRIARRTCVRHQPHVGASQGACLPHELDLHSSRGASLHDDT